VGVAGVNVVKQGDMEISGDQQRQPHDPQVQALLFALAPLGERGRGIEGVNEGIEVGRIVEEAGEIDPEALDERAGEVLLDGRDLLGVQVTHVVPEALAGERRRGDGEEAAQHGALIPVGHPGLAGRSQAAVQRGEAEVGSDADALFPFAGMAIDRGHQIQLARQVIQSGGGSEISQCDFLGRGWLGASFEVPGDVLGLSQVLLPGDFGSAVDTLTLAGVPVGVAADDFLVEADRHTLGHTPCRMLCQDVVLSAECGCNWRYLGERAEKSKFLYVRSYNQVQKPPEGHPCPDRIWSGHQG